MCYLKTGLEYCQPAPVNIIYVMFWIISMQLLKMQFTGQAWLHL